MVLTVQLLNLSENLKALLRKEGMLPFLTLEEALEDWRSKLSTHGA